MSLFDHLFNKFKLDEDQFFELISPYLGGMSQSDREHMESVYLGRFMDLHDTEFPQGYKNVPNEFYLYRLLFRTSSEQLNKESLGYHWTPDASLMEDKRFISMLGSIDDASLVLIIKTSLYWIRIEETIKQNLLYPHEREFNIGNTYNKQFDEIYYCNYKDFNVNNPLQSKNLTQLK